MKNKVELLAPAGDLERLKVTLLYGADAVYIGGKDYGLRANANNFSFEEMREACSFAHKLGKKVYVTVNIVFHNEDVKGIKDYLDEITKTGIDAVIVSDPFLISYVKKHYKNIEVHISTQNSTTNSEAVQFLKDEGADRIVLARELSKQEIKKIIDTTKVDIEVFVHGAMCTFYSGRCALSSYLTNRDANRGGCSQVCRFAFDLENYTTKFTFATKDLNMSTYLKDLVEIGVKSLKVEGRMRSLYYLATVIGSYRKLLDKVYDNTLTEEDVKKESMILERVANRENSTHYFMKEADMSDQYYTGRQEISNQDFLALVIGYDKEKRQIIVSERNYFDLQDEVELFTKDQTCYTFVIQEIYDEEGNKIEKARHPEQILKIPFDYEVEAYSMIRRKVQK